MASFRLPHYCRLTFVLAFALIILSAQTSQCQGTEGGALKKDTPLKVKIVDIRGTKVRLPIPDGYEEMKREDHPETYDWMKDITSPPDRMLQLVFLINSEDKIKLREDATFEFRCGFAISRCNQWDAVIEENSMIHTRGYFKEFIKDLVEGANELRKNDGEIKQEYRYIHNGIKTISALVIDYKNIKKYRSSFTLSYMILDKKVAEYTLYKKIYDTDDIIQIKNITLNFLKKIDKGSY